jgi:plastocyanin
MRYAISRRVLTLAAAGGALLFHATIAPAQQTAAAPANQVVANQVEANQVVVDNFAFAPVTLTVAPGTQVVWINHDGEPHTVVSVDGGITFKSPALDTDDKFAFVFAKPGTYKYFCSIHRHMVGTILVK